MLLLKLFASAVRQVPAIADRMENEVKVQQWDDERKRFAMELVREIGHSPICEPEATIEIEDGRFGPIFLTLTSSDLDKLSMGRDRYQLVEYVQKLIEDINSLTCEIVLEYERYAYYKDTDVFEAEIYWYI